MSLIAKSKKVWFQDGLRFSCIPGCRRCCGGAPGDVWVTEDEIQVIADHLKMDRESFELQYVRRYASGRVSLKERSNYDCILLDDHGCAVYPVRPKQCRDYPFWPELMKSKRAWSAEKKHCPGIDDGDLHAAPKITRILTSQQPDADV